ncbi:VWFA and cache domain-containing protein 1 [Lamellibrachia satsuma]|nr:VWFA and cache domain-containing protein 1 [Lamellibrachia satsuma]
MVNLGRLIAVVTYVVLSVHYTAAASDVVNGLTFYKELEKLKNEVLGVKKMQDIIDQRAMNYDEKIDGSAAVNAVAQSMSSKFSDAFKALGNIEHALLRDYDKRNFNRNGINRCCQIKDTETEYNFLFKKQVVMQALCYRKAAESNTTNQVPTSAELLMTFRENLGLMPHLKWQYYGTEGGLSVTYPAKKSGACGAYDPRFRPWYVEASTPVPKDIVIIIDRSDSMIVDKSHEHSKGGSQDSHRNPEPQRQGSVDTLSGCYSKELAFATTDNKREMNTYIDDMVAGGATNYIEPLEKAFKLLRSDQPGNRQKAILYLADGRTSTTPGVILDKIKQLNGELGNKVVILTYGIGNDLTESEKKFLMDMANQTQSDPTKGDIKRGRYTQVEPSMSLKVRLGSYYTIFSSPDNHSTPVISAPYVDYSGLGIVISVCKPVYKEEKLLGVAAVDLRLADLLTEATYYNGGEYSYAFIIDRTGRTLVHPLLPKPSVSETGRASVDISALEQNNVVQHVIDSMKKGNEGKKELDVIEVQSRGNPYLDGVNSLPVKATYQWKPIAMTDFSVCIVVTENSRLTKTKSRATARNFVYHRLDLEHSVSLCSIRKKKVATRESSVVKFTGSSFLDPNKYFNIKETKGTVKKYEDYMKGKDVSDNNIKDGVRQVVALSEELDTVWKSRGGTFWRYVAFINGVIRMFPGPIFPTNYDHTVRGWYQSALAHRDVTVLTPPYIDALGNGIVLTLCRALYQSRESGTHSTKDTVVGVVAMDFKLANIKKMLAKLFKPCDSDETSCFLVDTSGFLVYHDDFIKPDNKRLVSVHIAEKEVNIANDLIQSEIMTQGSCLGIITKKRTTHGRYRINKLYFLIKQKPKVDKLQDRSLAYSLEVVPETNVFLGVKKKIAPNALCKSCPDNSEGKLSKCDFDDRSAPNGQKRCHCPCYVGADFQSCKNVFKTERDRTIPCTPVEQHVTYPSPMKKESAWAATFPSCYETDCTGITIKSECISDDDCEWCNSGTQPCRGKGKCPMEPPETGKFGIGIIIGAVVGAVFVVAIIIVVVVVRYRRTLSTRAKNVYEGNHGECLNQQQHNLSVEVSDGENRSQQRHLPTVPAAEFAMENRSQEEREDDFERLNTASRIQEHEQNYAELDISQSVVEMRTPDNIIIGFTLCAVVVVAIVIVDIVVACRRTPPAGWCGDLTTTRRTDSVSLDPLGVGLIIGISVGAVIVVAVVVAVAVACCRMITSRRMARRQYDNSPVRQRQPRPGNDYQNENETVIGDTVTARGGAGVVNNSFELLTR